MARPKPTEERNQRALAEAVNAHELYEAAFEEQADGSKLYTMDISALPSYHYPKAFFALERPPTVLGVSEILEDIGRDDVALGPLYQRMSTMLRFRVPGWLLTLCFGPIVVGLGLLATFILIATGAKLLGAEIAWSDLALLWTTLFLAWFLVFGLANLLLMCWRAIRPFDWVCFLLENANAQPRDFLHRVAKDFARPAVTPAASLQRAEAILMRRTLPSRRYGTSTARDVDLGRRRDAARALGYAELLLTDHQRPNEEHAKARYLIDRVRVQTRLRDWSCRAELPDELFTPTSIHTSRKRTIWHALITVVLPVAAGLAGVYAAIRSEPFGEDLDWLTGLFN